MAIPPLVRQFLIAGSTFLTALSAGSISGYPSVLLQQLQGNNTIVQVDLHNGSWIGSVHGIAGITSILLPLLMQYRGRKFAYIVSCTLMIIGWIFMYLAQSLTTIIIGECFHGIGGSSAFTVSVLSMSEMVQPKYRNPCIVLYGTFQALGVSLIGILGRFLHWKTAGIIMCIPVSIALLIAFAWPESPSWLACKGRFEECENIFKKLRGTDEQSNKELKAIVSSHKESLRVKPQGAYNLRRFYETITSRDFYVPALHIFVLMNIFYWGGGMPTVIYGGDMIVQSTGKPNPQAKTVMDGTLFLGYIVATVLVRYFSNKKLLLWTVFGCMMCMASAATITYLQYIGEVAMDSQLAVYSLIGFMMFLSFGACSVAFSIASEIMPVKHRGIGGCFYIFCMCALHSFSLKTYPYLCVYLNIWGVFTIYAVYQMLSLLIIWKYVPDTTHKTLHEIEQFYNRGYLKGTTLNENVSVPFINK